MKTSSIPPLRVSPALRKKAESLLEEGETLSAFLLDAVTRNIEYREARQGFIERGLASAATARKTGNYVSADKVIGKLEGMLVKAKKRAS